MSIIAIRLGLGLLLLAGLAAFACDDSAEGDEDAGADTDTDTDTDTDADTDTDTDACAAGGNWYDPATGLCWQNPPSDETMTWGGADPTCDDLSLGGFDDWRLPIIQELISLLRGCADGVETGDLTINDCGVTEPDCLGMECDDGSCWGCDVSGGPDDDPDGCYWDYALDGSCFVYWSSSLASTGGDDAYVWAVSFSSADVAIREMQDDGMVRCVRDGP